MSGKYTFEMQSLSNARSVDKAEIVRANVYSVRFSVKATCWFLSYSVAVGVGVGVGRALF